ncbi:UNVERIFIED_CONTAM: high-affinity Zn(2+) transporter zrt1 [Siphonaria sp. JEL0065]|nr:high-affinity Zn(2+) transporter zrt1 [Siphonaria sp. JEL0065]
MILSIHRNKLKTHEALISNSLLLFKMFGIGVIAGTAWIHLLPDAFSQFSSPCLADGWKSYGPAYVGLFGMTAAFLVQLVEFTAEGIKTKTKRTKRRESECVDLTQNPSLDSGSEKQHPLNTIEIVSEPSTVETTALTLAPSGSDFVIATDSDGTTSPLTPTDANPTPSFLNVIPSAHGGAMSHDLQTPNSSTELSTIILELGILFHSLIIGITLGVTPDDAFGTLLAAICFHQMFEGMALGVLIGDLSNLSNGTKKLLGLMYPMTTPIGLAIGIAVRNSYNSNSSTLIVVQGILDSLSAGILFFNTYCELMSEQVSHSPHFLSLGSTLKIASFLAMYLGAAAMAIVALWA